MPLPNTFCTLAWRLESGLHEIFTSPTETYLPVPPNRNSDAYKSTRPRDAMNVSYFHMTHCYLPFLPRDYQTCPLGSMWPHFQSPWVALSSSGKYQIHGVSGWQELQTLFKNIAFSLLRHSGNMSRCPIYGYMPTAYDFTQEFDTEVEAERSLRSAYESFYLLLAFVSYSIHITLAPGGPSRSGTIPWWQTRLIQDQVAHSTISTLASSWVGNGYVRRLGCFLDADQPIDVDSSLWHAFASAGVPVFVRWGTDYHITTARVPPFIALLRPSRGLIKDAIDYAFSAKPAPAYFPPGQYQTNETEVDYTADAETFRPASPTDDYAAVIEDIDDERRVTYTHWRVFRENREVKHAKYLASETDDDKRKRLGRLRNAQKQCVPGKKGAKVYRWEKNVHGTWDRIETKRQAVQEHWLNYTSSQRVYDPIFDQWDLCQDFDPGSVADDEMQEPYDVEETDWAAIQLPDVGYGATVHSELQKEYTSIAATAPSVISFHRDLPASLFVHFGFMRRAFPLTPFPSNIPLLAWVQAQHTALEFGTQCSPSDVFPCRQFITIVAYRQSGSSLPEWNAPDSVVDFGQLLEHRNPNLAIKRLARVRGSTMYELCSGDGPSDVSWHLLVPDAATAVECLRNTALGPSIRETARYLMREGRPFLTAAHFSSCPPAAPEERCRFLGLGWRAKDWVQQQTLDYGDYVLHRNELLRGPRGRVALMRGGIVWRLAMEVLEPDVVLGGPLPIDEAEARRYFSPGKQDGYYVDDELTEHELNIICGVYTVAIDDRDTKQTADMSWWPKHAVFNGAGLDVGYWTPECEDWFQVRAKQLAEGVGKLRTSTSWRDALRRNKATSKLAGNYEVVAAEFLRRL